MSFVDERSRVAFPTPFNLRVPHAANTPCREESQMKVFLEKLIEEPYDSEKVFLSLGPPLTQIQMFAHTSSREKMFKWEGLLKCSRTNSNQDYVVSGFSLPIPQV